MYTNHELNRQNNALFFCRFHAVEHQIMGFQYARWHFHLIISYLVCSFVVVVSHANMFIIRFCFFLQFLAIFNSNWIIFCVQWSMPRDQWRRHYFWASPAYSIQHAKIAFGSVAMIAINAQMRISQWRCFQQKICIPNQRYDRFCDWYSNESARFNVSRECDSQPKPKNANSLIFRSGEWLCREKPHENKKNN